MTGAGGGQDGRSVGDVDLEHVAVIVVMYNSAHLLPDFVASVREGMAGISYELIAVDNDSPDSSAAQMAELAPEATVVRTGRNGGYAAGINAGQAAAGPATAVLVLNSDVRLLPGCAQELLRKLRLPGVGITVPKLFDGDGVVIDSMRREPTALRAIGDAVLGAARAGRIPALGEIVSPVEAYDVEQVTDWAEGSTQLISNECWDICGPWDESFFLYCEETEYNLRARDRGFATLFVPSAHAVHLSGGSGVSNELWTLQVTNRIILFRRRNGAAAACVYWGATLARELTRAMMGRANSAAAVRGLLRPAALRAVLRRSGEA